MATVDGYDYFRSNRKGFKLAVDLGDRVVHFGSTAHQHFFDRTGLLDPRYNHLDPVRRRNYLRRSAGIRDKNGRLTAADPYSANFHARRVLW